MKKSLQDQLIKAGLGHKQQARQINTFKKKNRQGQQQQSGSSAEEIRAAQAEKDRERNRDLQQLAQEKAAKAEIGQLIDSNTIALNDQGIPYYFVVHNRIKKIRCPDRIRIQLAHGQAIIVQHINRDQYCVLPGGLADKLSARNYAHLIVWQQHRGSLKAYLDQHQMEDYTEQDLYR